MALHHFCSTQPFGSSCPLSGTFYVCDGGSEFVGCCDIEPCTVGCTDGNVEPASFDSIYSGQIPNQDCPSRSRWYTCGDTNPTFLGCCESNACIDGCPAGQVTAGFLSGIPHIAAPFLQHVYPHQDAPLNTTSSTRATLTSSARLSGRAVLISNPYPLVAAGTAIFLAMIIALIVWMIYLCRRHKRNRARKDSTTDFDDNFYPSEPEMAQTGNVPVQSVRGQDVQPPPRGSSQLSLVNNGPTERVSTAQPTTPIANMLTASSKQRAHTSPNSPGTSESSPAGLKGSTTDPLPHLPPYPRNPDRVGFMQKPATTSTDPSSTTMPSQSTRDRNDSNAALADI